MSIAVLQKISRRRALQGGLAVAAGAVVAPALVHAKALETQPLRMAFIGIGGRGSALLGMADGKSRVCVAYCDADKRRWGGCARRFEQAKPYQDYRKMFDEMQREIDAVVVATPDHHHAPASLLAIKLGKAVYCEKPLAYSVHEARVLAAATVKHKVATQMGNHAHANEGNRRTVEWIRDGAIGDVVEIHTWTNRPANFWKHGYKEIPPQRPCPAELDWECWLGPRTWPYYCDHLLGMQWRSWYDLGTGAIGDQICHGWDNVFWSMDAGAPTSAEPLDLVGQTRISPPLQSTIRFEFPARGARKPFVAYYHTGGRRPPVPAELINDPVRQGKGDLPATGTLYTGTKGKLLVAGDYGESPRLVPEAAMKAYHVPAPSIPRSPGHFEEWFQAARGEKPWNFPKSNFTYAGPLAEVGLLGIVAERVGKKIEWDAAAGKVTNLPEANQYVKPTFRKGWEVEL